MYRKMYIFSELIVHNTIFMAYTVKLGYNLDISEYFYSHEIFKSFMYLIIMESL